jgi:2-keto-4-pentenoate hydratase/2-oxohepta-3-ene-1,7-dioic acid hydratase in catechol pathway
MVSIQVIYYFNSMKLLRFGQAECEKPGILVNHGILDVSAANPEIRDFNAAFYNLENLAELKELAGNSSSENLLPLSGVRIGPPIKDPSKIICLGMNFAEHATEGKRKPPASPILFCKALSSLNGPFDPVVIPYEHAQADWEVELAVVIGRKAKGVKRDRAMDYVFGYTVLNDVSGRQAQFGDKQWFRGKSFDTFAPLGPYVVTRDEIGDPHNLDLFSKVNGEIQQSGNTRDLIFDIPFLIEFISQGITLVPGDIISTGTPAGVGVFQDPQRFLKSGDVVEVGVQDLGSQRSEVTH